MTVNLQHLNHLTNHYGIFEHARGTEPRSDHGFCTDDNARLLAVACQEQGVVADRLTRIALRFVHDSHHDDGRTSNRMNAEGIWTDEPTVDDCWGRAIWGLGTAVAKSDHDDVRRHAMSGFSRAIQQRSQSPRAMAFASIGASEVVSVVGPTPQTTQLLTDAIVCIGLLRFPHSTSWVWPERRLRYANAALAEALIAAGSVLNRNDALDSGLRMLDWLVRIQSTEGHLSVVGASGRGPGPSTRQFDQQPVEVAGLADACARAGRVTGDSRWSLGITLAADWFCGMNDVGLMMFDEISGGGFDGLHHDRVSLNQGAESTLAYVSTMQRASQMVPSP